MSTIELSVVEDHKLAHSHQGMLSHECLLVGSEIIIVTCSSRQSFAFVGYMLLVIHCLGKRCVISHLNLS